MMHYIDANVFLNSLLKICNHTRLKSDHTTCKQNNCNGTTNYK